MTEGSTSPLHIATQEIPGRALLKESRPAPCKLVVFGATGDLTHRKLLPSLFSLAQQKALPEHFRLIGLSRQELSSEEFRGSLREAAERRAGERPFDDAAWSSFASGISYVIGNFDDPAAYTELQRQLAPAEREGGTRGNCIFYLAVPPRFFPLILQHLRGSGLIHEPGGEPWSRVIIEKPFGRDLASAQELNTVVATCLDESQTYRIDHYLGKETVQNILVFRFGNTVFEEFWNRKYVDHIEITAAESLDVGGRGRFYDATGVLRDIVQNHLLQVLALCAMEPPVSFRANDVRDEKAQLLRSLRVLTGAAALDSSLLGQYSGYHAEDGVASDSRTPTYAAMKLYIDNWRWQGVPIYLRAGKALSGKVTEVALHLKSIPLCLFSRDETCQRIAPNVLTLRLQPDEGISLRFVSKVPGEDLRVANVSMDMSYETAFGTAISDAYQRLLLDCMRGDATLFARRDEVEGAWRFITPILEAWSSPDAPPPAFYDPGSEGPKEARAFIARDRRSWTPLT